MRCFTGNLSWLFYIGRLFKIYYYTLYYIILQFMCKAFFFKRTSHFIKFTSFKHPTLCTNITTRPIHWTVSNWLQHVLGNKPMGLLEGSSRRSQIQSWTISHCEGWSRYSPTSTIHCPFVLCSMQNTSIFLQHSCSIICTQCCSNKFAVLFALKLYINAEILHIAVWSASRRFCSYNCEYQCLGSTSYTDESNPSFGCQSFLLPCLHSAVIVLVNELK